MIPSDQPSSPYKKHLNNRIFPFRSCRQNISVFSSRICDLLFLSNLFHTVYQFPVFDRTFKLQILRGGIHFFFQLFQDHIIISIQKLQHFRDRRPVVFLRNIALTRSVALLDMIIKTRTFFPDIFWKISMRLCVLHNLYFYNTMMEEIREAIEAGEYKAYKKRKLEGMMQ